MKLNLGLELRDGEPELLGVLPAREVSEVRQERNQHLQVVYFIRAHLRGASLGTRTELGHGLIIVLEMAWVRQ